MQTYTKPEVVAAPVEGRQVVGKRALIIWSLQLLFPAIGLVHVFIWAIDGFPFGRFGWLLLAFCSVWCGACLFVLTLPAGRKWIIPQWRRLLTLYFLGAAGLVATEAYLRALPVTFFDPRRPHITQLSAELGWCFRPGVQDIGEHGFRLPSYPTVKAPGRYRIVCIGDSTTFGSGCSWKDAWPHQLEVLLNSDSDWLNEHGRTEVLNLGVLMYGPDQSFLVLRNTGLLYAPDLVIFHLSCDDFADCSFDHYWKKTDGILYKPFYLLKDGEPVLGRDCVPPSTDNAGHVLDNSGQILPEWQLIAFSFLRHGISTGFRQTAPIDPPEPTNAHWPIHEAFRKQYQSARPLLWALIKEMATASSRAGARFLLTLSPHDMCSARDDPPWRIKSFLREYQDDARARGIVASQCVSDYFAEGGNQRFLVHTSDRYLNPQGNALVARATAQKVKEELQK